MRSLLFILLQRILAGALAPVAAQDGTLLERSPFVWPKEFVDDMRTSMPEVDSLLAAVNVYRITYRSDGLKGCLEETAQTGGVRASSAMAKSWIGPMRCRTNGENPKQLKVIVFVGGCVPLDAWEGLQPTKSINAPWAFDPL